MLGTALRLEISAESQRNLRRDGIRRRWLLSLVRTGCMVGVLDAQIARLAMLKVSL